MLFQDQVKPEFMQSQVEIGSQVCRNIKEARQEITRLRSVVAEIAQKRWAQNCGRRHASLFQVAGSNYYR